tara:strand:+ start:627 stop:1085 length:459 start_codon:yes stop_codon:yes gene_type:complete
MSESFNFSVYEDNNEVFSYRDTFGDIFDNINFTQHNRRMTFVDVLNTYMGDIFQQTNIRYVDPFEIAIQESLNNYKHAEKKPIKLQVNTKKFSETKKKYTTCTICQDDFSEDDVVSVLECYHCFHEKCISEWGKYKPECPNCQKSIKYFIEK